MRAATFFLSSLLVSASAWSQSPDAAPTDAAAPTTAPAAASEDRHNQRIERIRVEDGGSRVDELRVGGETKSITVQPKVGGLPAYDVAPARDAHGASQDGTTGRRTWKALQF